MIKNSFHNLIFLFLIIAIFSLQSCESIDDERIPNMPVNISLADAGLWNTYGVSGFGSHRNFIYGKVPSGFPYKTNSATGFGGILLIEGMDPYNNLGTYPLAYDLACPVERDPNIRVQISNADYVAYCPQCKSSYDVTMAAGAPISGEALEGKYKYRLKMYTVVQSGYGGYFITN